MKSRELDKMDDPFTYIKQDDDVGEVEGLKWVKSNGESAPEWIEDDDDFRVVLRRPVDWNEGTLGSDGVISRTTQETTLQTNQETVKKSRDRNDGKSRDRNSDKSRDRSVTRTLEYKCKSDNPKNVGVAKSRDRNVTKSRDWSDVMTTQQTTQRTTQQTPWNTARWKMGVKKHSMNSYNEGNLIW